MENQSQTQTRKKDNFCKNNISRYIECLKLNINVFGSEHGPSMCQNYKDIIDFAECDLVKYTSINLNNFDHINKKL